jgi:probable F420-dependent oxidoreductase
MDAGVFIFATDLTPSIAQVAVEAEARGFDLLLLPEHTHIPVSRRTLSPTGGPLPDEHRRSLDPFVALATAAASTARLKIGTGVCLVAQRDPIILAKEVASLDFVSGGRFVFGVGHGWHADEVGNHGIRLADRRSVAREKIMAMRSIWTHDVSEWRGDHVEFTPLWSWPKPVQHPYPPILLGGSPNRAVLDDVVACADGWMPYAWFHDVEAGHDRLRQAAEQAGRDPATIELVVMGCRAAAHDIERYHGLGAGAVVFDLPAEGRDALMARLDRYAAVVAASGVERRSA